MKPFTTGTYCEGVQASASEHATPRAVTEALYCPLNARGTEGRLQIGTSASASEQKAFMKASGAAMRRASGPRQLTN